MTALEPTAPTSVRRLDTPAARSLADLASTYDELGTALRCCERLMGQLATPEPDDLLTEALWTTTVLSYARCFAPSRLTAADVTRTGLEGDVARWHEMLLRMREHFADPATNPRERYSVGASQDGSGRAEGIAITSAPQPLVDETTVRQTGALAYALSRTVNDRISAQQQKVFSALPADLTGLPLVEVR